MEHLKVIVVGAGMGGLTSGLALSQARYEVEIYDRVRELRPVGAGISLWSNGVKVLNRLGLGAEIARIGGQMDRTIYFDASGNKLTEFTLDPLIQRVGQCPYPVARSDLQNLLLEAFGRGRVKLNAKCVGVEESNESVTAIFEDGHRATGDLLVAADGTHSRLREYVLGRPTERRYVGYVNWNGLVPANTALAPPNSWVIYVGNGQRASLMPVGGKWLYFFLDVPLPKGMPKDPSHYTTELAEYFEGWAAPVQMLIQQLRPERINRVEIHDIEPLQTLVRGRVALLGDAAHSTAPDLGQGGCQAMEDAEVLARCLQTTNLGVPDALKRYEAARKDRVADIILRARKRADTIHGKDPALTQQWYEELKREDGEKILDALARTILAGPLQ